MIRVLIQKADKQVIYDGEFDNLDAAAAALDYQVPSLRFGSDPRLGEFVEGEYTIDVLDDSDPASLGVDLPTEDLDEDLDESTIPDLSELGVADAREVVKGEKNPAVLSAWLEIETRSTVKTAIVNRLKELEV